VALHCWGYNGTSREVDAVARSLTSDYGLNGWEITFGIIPWLQMCKQAGLIDSIGADGSIGNGCGSIPIPVGEKPVQYMRDVALSSSEFLHALIHAIAFREGELGEALAEGTCYAAEQLFDGAGLPFLDTIYPRRCGQTHHWAGHWGPGGTVYWPWWLPPVLQWCTDTRDPASDSTHQWTEHVQNYMPVSGPRRGKMPVEQVRAVCEQVYGHPDVCDDRYTYDPPELKALPALWHSQRGMLVNSMVFCDREHSRVFATTGEDGKADTGLMARLFSTCTGMQASEEELNQAGERIWNLLRAIDVRFFGRDRAIDESTLDAFMYPGKDDGVMLDRERFIPLLDKYYQLSGWDAAHGWPTRAKLDELGLSDIADVLQSEGKLG
jgi:aldehyde:ferredoxin oxidoreductase